MILFLDIDGVLNNLKSLRRGEDLDIQNIIRFKILVKRIKPQIVLSSTWRLFQDHKDRLRDCFIKNDIPLWIGQTQDLTGKERWEEIESWCLEKSVDKCIVIDDDGSAFSPNATIPTLKVKTDFRTGLTLHDVRKLLGQIHDVS
jgi:hypothetical protein